MVDDGIATGYTARAALESLKQSKAKRAILAVPVAPDDTLGMRGIVIRDQLGPYGVPRACSTWTGTFAVCAKTKKCQELTFRARQVPAVEG